MEEQNTWPTDEVLKANRYRLMGELEKRLRQYEARYELKSEQLDGELQAGRIRDTAEICEWVIAYHTYSILQYGRQARLE